MCKAQDTQLRSSRVSCLEIQYLIYHQEVMLQIQNRPEGGFIYPHDESEYEMRYIEMEISS